MRNPYYLFIIFVLIIVFVDKSLKDYGSSSYQSYIAIFSTVLSFFIIRNLKVLKGQDGMIKLVLTWLIWMITTSFIVHPLGRITLTFGMLLQSILWVLVFLLFFIYSYKFPHWVYRNSKQFFFIVLFFSGFIFLTLRIDERNVYLSYYAIASLPWIFLFNKAIWRYIGILFIFFISIFAEKRGGFLALIFAILIFYSLESYIKRGAGLRIFYLILIFGFLVIVVMQLVQITGSSIIERMSLLKEDEGSGRIDIYEDLISSIKKFDLKTLSFGSGHNSTAEIVGTFAHNEFLQILVDYGIVGLLLYIFLNIILIRKSIILIKNKSIYASSFCASYIIFLIIAMVSHWFVMAQFVIVLVSYWGLIFALTAKRRCSYS